MSLKIAITGATGMLGKSLSQIFPTATRLKGKKTVDLTNFKASKNYFNNKYFDYIIHTAAFTSLKYCDKNKKAAYALHADIVPLLNNYCRHLIYISTVPSTSTRSYHLSKQKGEELTLKRSSNAVIRTNLYGNGGLVHWAISNLTQGAKLQGYTNVKFNGIHVDQLSLTLRRQLSTLKGLVNIGGNYIISKYDFLVLLARHFNLNERLIEPTRTLFEPHTVIPLDSQHYSHSLSEGLRFLTPTKLK